MGVQRSASKIDFAAIRNTMQPSVEAWYDGNARIQIVDPNIAGGTFDRTTNVKDRTPVIIWEGDARIQAVRWPNVATTRQEAVSERTVVFHLAVSDTPVPGLILEGWRIRVIDGGEAPEFESGLFVVTNSVNSSYDWDRRIECVMDQGTIV